MPAQGAFPRMVVWLHHGPSEHIHLQQHVNGFEKKIIAHQAQTIIHSFFYMLSKYSYDSHLNGKLFAPCCNFRLSSDLDSQVTLKKGYNHNYCQE